MNYRIPLCALWALCLATIAASPGSARDINIVTRADGSWDYFALVMTKVFEGSEHKIVIQKDLPQVRVEQGLDRGEIDFHVFVAGPARNARWIPIPVGLTGGLIGKRILLVQAADLPKFAAIKTLEDLQKSGLVGGFGKSWSDVDIWKANGLPYAERDGDWHLIYRQIGQGRGIDYFSRGALEAGPELAGLTDIPGLSLEPTLMLVYDADFQFYGAKNAADVAPFVQKRLEAMKADGTLDALFKTQTKWADALKIADLAKRHAINLKLPGS